ncbi:MAG TPA: 16S rRNA (guanine(966)-N(2))-methyltransferase RsmD [Rhodobacteraceae bacterium]|jgi:16S rRNA (guanine966-N2)-methyltransferase|nr:16S rRNA (guanine(966)-N(2))-methyltransferase RsmD [Paracoccaceae bacterium]
MRIIAGQHRGLKLATIGKGDVVAHLRPTSDRVRESLFSVLMGGAYGNPISGAQVLDLFAGTGALGLEALSRGANNCTFIDDGRKAQSLIRENINLTRRSTDSTVLRANATRLPANKGKPHNLVFLDPPYGKELGELALAAACDNNWLAKNALIIWEESSPKHAPDGYQLFDQRKYGDTWISILGKQP